MDGDNYDDAKAAYLSASGAERFGLNSFDIFFPSAKVVFEFFGVSTIPVDNSTIICNILIAQPCISVLLARL